MATKFLELTLTDSVRKAQEHYYRKSRRIEAAPEHDVLTEDETSFIQSRDSFYMATINESGWPYIQHRGGKPGFLRVIGSSTLAFADYKAQRLNWHHFEVHYLPGYSPDFNPIERLWFRLKADFFSDFIAKSPEELTQRLVSPSPP